MISSIAVTSEDLFVAEEPFGCDTAVATLLNQLVRFDDRARSVGINNRRQVGQPWLLAPRIDLNLRVICSLEDVDSFSEIRAVEPARLVHLSRDRTVEQRTIQPRQWSTVTLHADEQHVDRADRFVQTIVEFRFDVVRISGAEDRFVFGPDEIGDLGGDVEIAVFAKERQPDDAAAFKLDLFHLVYFDDVLEAEVL